MEPNTPMGTPPLYPVGLVVSGRPCLVVGGGPVAGRKIGALVRCGAAVTVVAPEAHRAMAVLAGDGTLEELTGPPIDLQLRPYRRGEAAGFRLVVTATGVAAVDRVVRLDAEAAGVWVNSADDPDNCTFLLPAVHRDGPVTVAVATGGASPALAAWLRRRVADALGPGLGDLAELLEEARGRIRARGVSTESIDWTGVLEGPVPGLVAEGRMDEAREALRAGLGPWWGPAEAPGDGPTGPGRGN